MTFRNEERQKEQMVTQEGLLQLLVQMEKELEGHLLKIAVLRAKTDGEIKFSKHRYRQNDGRERWVTVF